MFCNVPFPLTVDSFTKLLRINCSDPSSKQRQSGTKGGRSHHLMVGRVFGQPGSVLISKRRTQTPSKSLKKPLLRQKDDYIPQVR